MISSSSISNRNIDGNDGSIEDFSIHFDNKDGCYFVDNTLSGKVRINTRRNLFVHELSTSIIGRAKVFCNGGSTNTTRIDEDFVYLKKEWTFIRKPGIRLVEGIHQMTFNVCVFIDSLKNSFL